MSTLADALDDVRVARTSRGLDLRVVHTGLLSELLPGDVGGSTMCPLLAPRSATCIGRSMRGGQVGDVLLREHRDLASAEAYSVAASPPGGTLLLTGSAIITNPTSRGAAHRVASET